MIRGYEIFTETELIELALNCDTNVRNKVVDELIKSFNIRININVVMYFIGFMHSSSFLLLDPRLYSLSSNVHRQLETYITLFNVKINCKLILDENKALFNTAK